MESHFERLVSQGRISFSKREYRKALGLWQDALKLQPESIDLMNSISKTHLHLAEFSKAEKLLSMILEKQPDAGDILLELVRLKLITGDIIGVRFYWKKLNGMYPNDPGVKTLYGDFLVLEGRYQEAEDVYREAVATPQKSMLQQSMKSLMIKLAACYSAQGETELGQHTFDKVDIGESEPVEILLQAANYWKLQENMEKAESVIKRAVQAEPEDLGLKMVMARFYFDTGRFGDSRSIIEMLIEKDPDNSQFRKYLIKILMAQNQLDKIPTMLEEFGTEMENDIEFNLLAGKYNLFMHNPIFAEEHFKRVIRENSDHFMAHYLLGVTYLLGERIYLARKSLIKSLSLNPLFSDAEILLADIYYKKGEFDFSWEHISRVIEREPENFRAHIVMGNILVAQRRYDEALDFFQIAYAINPDSDAAVYYIASVSEHLGEKDWVVEMYRALLERNPDLADAAWRLKELLMETGKNGQARKYFESATAKSPENGYLYHILGEFYLESGDTVKAVGCFKRAVNLLPDLTSSYIKLAEIYAKDYNFDAEMDTLKTCTDQVTDFLGCYLKLAGLYLQKGENDKAIELLETALLGNPDSALITNNLAYLYLEEDRDINKAFELARTAYKLKPEAPFTLDTLGWAYYKKKMYVQAVNYLENATELSPDHPDVKKHLSLAREALQTEIVSENLSDD